MADEKKTTAAKTQSAKKESKAKKEKKGSKPNFFVRMKNAVKRFCKDLKGEVKKITWPDSQTVLKGAGVVVAAVVIVGIPIWLADLGMAELLNLLQRLSEKVNAEPGLIGLFGGLL